MACHVSVIAEKSERDKLKVENAEHAAGVRCPEPASFVAGTAMHAFCAQACQPSSYAREAEEVVRNAAMRKAVEHVDHHGDPH